MSHTVRFSKRSEFDRDLRKATDAYFETQGISQTGSWKMWLKSAILLGGLATIVTTFVTLTPGWATTIALAVVCGLFMAGIGFAVQHDANHGSYSKNKKVNSIMGFSLDLLGASSYVWRMKHNRIHHAYTNVSGVDDDLDVGLIARFAPGQRRLAVHRFQHLYMWVLYGFLTLKWYFDDFVQVGKGRIGDRKLPRPKGLDLALFLGGKALFAGWMVALPLATVGLAHALAFYLIAEMVLGVVLAVVFQLAHCVESAQFVIPEAEGTTRLPMDFALHQLQGTVDFARDNRLITWYVGGLNYQVLHHLFPRVCHIHYPALSKILQEVADAHGVLYRHVPTLGQALAGHYRSLRRLGRGEDELALNGVIEATGQPAASTFSAPEPALSASA